MMRRNAEGKTEWLVRGARLLGWTAIAVFAIDATRASAANVAEVRVGTHEKSTRIVLELDQASGYRLVTPQEGNPELLIHLDAASVARDVPSKSPLVRKVRVEPSGSGSTVRIRLATPNVAVKELLLASPPRLVFDLVGQGPIPKAPIEEEVSEEPAEPASDTKEIASAAPPAPAKIEDPKPIAAEPAKAVVVAAADAPSASAAEQAPSRPASEAKPLMPPAPVAPIVDSPELPSQSEAPAVQPTPSAEQAALPSSASASSPSAEARRKAIAAKTAQPASESGGSIASLATSPLGLGAIAAVVLLIGGIFVMRRRRSSEGDDSLYSMMAAEDAAITAAPEAADDVRAEPVRAAPIWEPDAFDASEPTPKLGQQLTFGSRPLAPEPVEPKIAAPDDTDADSIFGGSVAAEPTPIAVATTVPVVAAASEETERRIAELERRIEQLADARERLERQVAAQTEELRVQRAAIARTQRVVRSIAKTEDMATEPVPRAPSAS